jgi:hypothetical protein
MNRELTERRGLAQRAPAYVEAPARQAKNRMGSTLSSRCWIAAATLFLFLSLMANARTNRELLVHQLVGTWSGNSESGALQYVFKADHTWLIRRGAGSPLQGRWRIDGNDLMTYVAIPQTGVDQLKAGSRSERRRETIVELTAKRLVLKRDGELFMMYKTR